MRSHASGVWECLCDCGGTLSTTASNLNRGKAIKCGDDDAHYPPSYNRAHKRVKRLKGSASAHPCVDCGLAAKHWSYDHTDPAQGFGKVNAELYPFSMNPEHYSPRCVKCHKAFDNSNSLVGATA